MVMPQEILELLSCTQCLCICVYMCVHLSMSGCGVVEKVALVDGGGARMHRYITE